MGIAERIAEIEKEIARTQKNKGLIVKIILATEHHIGLLKARLAKLRSELIEASEEASGKGEGFEVLRCGNARVALIGFPSVGKSTLLSSITSCKSEVADYAFTTLTCIPGMIEVFPIISHKYNDTKIQMLDLPEIHHAEIVVRQDCDQGKLCYIIFDEFIDVLIGNRVYIPALYVYNKIDRMSIEDIDVIAHAQYSVVISCNYKLNFDYLLKKIWEHLGLLRIYTKRPGELPDFNEPLILRTNSSVKEACLMIHRSLVDHFKYSIVWVEKD
ncbi:hypothetical protein HZS_2525 [Henneguya salminicola]|nr:hypothetical protein HZS_2525 [Henneguya salminicola]